MPFSHDQKGPWNGPHPYYARARMLEHSALPARLQLDIALASLESGGGSAADLIETARPPTGPTRHTTRRRKRRSCRPNKTSQPSRVCQGSGTHRRMESERENFKIAGWASQRQKVLEHYNSASTIVKTHYQLLIFMCMLINLLYFLFKPTGGV